MLCIAIYEFWKVNKSRTNIEGRALIFKSTKRGLEMCPIYYSCLGYTLSDSHCDYVLVLKYSCWVEFPRQHYYHHIGYAFSWMKREPNNKDPNYCFFHFMMMTHICDMYSAYTPCEGLFTREPKVFNKGFHSFWW